MQSLLPADLMTVRQVAELFHLGEKSILNRIKDGRLYAQKLAGGKQWLIRREDAQAALQAKSDDLASPNSQNRLEIVRAGTDPMRIERDAGIIRRTHTPEGRARAVAMLRRLRAGDAQEQTETWNFLKTVLDDDRPSYRKLFPEHETYLGSKPE